MSKREPKVTIGATAQARIRDACWRSQSTWEKNNGNDALSYFQCDHGNSIVVAKSGKKDLLFTHGGDQLRSNAARFIAGVSPVLVEELLRGYRIAGLAGLLGDGKPALPDVAAAQSTLRGHFTNGEHVASGQDHIEYLTEVIRLHGRKENLW